MCALVHMRMFVFVSDQTLECLYRKPKKNIKIEKTERKKENTKIIAMLWCCLWCISNSSVSTRVPQPLSNWNILLSFM